MSDRASAHRRDEIFPKWGPAFPSSVPLSAMAAARSGTGMTVGAMSGRRGLGLFVSGMDNTKLARTDTVDSRGVIPRRLQTVRHRAEGIG
jgi:hypothetical protein